MKSRTAYLTFNTPTRRAFINITPQVSKVVGESGVKEGLCLVNAMHISASVFMSPMAEAFGAIKDRNSRQAIVVQPNQKKPIDDWLPKGAYEVKEQ